MGQHTARRSFGTALLGLGLILVLVVAGYFAWSEIQSAQVRAQLRKTASGATVHAAAVAADPAAESTAPAPTQAAPKATQTKSAQAAVVAEATRTATRKPVQVTATRRPATATLAPSATAAPPKSSAAGASAAAPPPTGTSSIDPVRMTIPDLKIDAAVVPMGWKVVQTPSGPVTQWMIPEAAAGHHINSAGIGEPGNLVISGHNNIYGQVFKPISLAWDNDTRVKVDNFTDKSDILNGRTIELFDAQGKQYSYTITGFYRLKDTGVSQAQRIANGKYILPTEDERLTIVTCWPPTNNTHRLIVIAEPKD